MASNTKQTPNLLPLLLPAALLAGTCALYQGLITRFYSLPTPKLRPNQRLRLVVLSDLHGTWFDKEQVQLLTRLQELRPDYILLAGDIIDERFPLGAAIALMRGAAATAPTYYAMGNHEYRTGRLAGIISLAHNCGVIPLVDRSATLDTSAGKLLIAGCEDYERLRLDPGYNQPFSLRDAFPEIRDEKACTVLMAHRPERIALYQMLGFDFVVSGHAHGGQWRIPGVLNGFFAPNQGFFPQYAGGCYRHPGMVHLVSRGLVVYPGIPRIFNPPEITVMDLVGISS